MLMNFVTSPTDRATAAAPPLVPGDRMRAAEFRRRDKDQVENRFELIEGIVHMAAATRVTHARPQSLIVGWANAYCADTEGTDCLDDATDRLDDENEPRPDVSILWTSEHRGQTFIDDEGYLNGGPELIVEMAASSEAIDRGIKRRVYERHGVREYGVWRINRGLIQWYRLDGGTLQPVTLDNDGVYRSVVFPGLWLDTAAAIAIDRRRVLDVLARGIASR